MTRCLLLLLCLVVGCARDCIVAHCMPDCEEKYTHDSADYQRDLRCTQCIAKCYDEQKDLL